MLFELLCNGEHPYQGGKPRVGADVRDPKQVRSDLDEALAAFLVKACAPYREDRFTTAVEMREALDTIRGSM